MKFKILIALVSCLTLAALADGPIIQTTPFMRNVLGAQSSSDAQTRLGFTGNTTLTVISNTAIAAVLPIPQKLFTFIGDSRMTNNAMVGTNVWPWLFAAGHEPCAVSNYAIAGITAQTIWSTWTANGGQQPNPGRAYTAFVAAGVNDVGASFNTSVMSSNLAFVALTNIWGAERRNGAYPGLRLRLRPISAI